MVTLVLYYYALSLPNIVIVHDIPSDPCNPSPCGSNAICRERNGAGSCACIPEYFGDPYVNCRPECVQNSDCSRTQSCLNMKCVNPCKDMCGFNADCHVSNHFPTCTCKSGYTGDPMRKCHEIPSSRFACTKNVKYETSKKSLI